jgi:DNA-binding IclR family transcriptional regulator
MRDGVQEGGARAAAPLQTLERALKLLFALADASGPRSLQDLGRLVDSSASSVHRTLATLEEFDLVERDLPSRRYRLGLGVLRLADARGRHLDIRLAARPFVEALRDQSRETVSLAVFAGREAIDVERAESPLDLRQTIQIGRRIPLSDLGARARIMLAALSSPELDAILDEVRWEGRPLTRPALLAELAQTRATGMARSFGERNSGAAAIAAAIHDHRGQTVAALLVSGPMFRFNADAMDRVEPDVRRAAAEIERQLGFLPTNGVASSAGG